MSVLRLSVLNFRFALVLFRVNSWIVAAQKTQSTKPHEIRANPSWFRTVQRASVHSCWSTKQLFDLSVGRLFRYEE